MRLRWIVAVYILHAVKSEEILVEDNGNTKIENASPILLKRNKPERQKHLIEALSVPPISESLLWENSAEVDKQLTESEAVPFNNIDVEKITFHLHTRKNRNVFQEIKETSINASYFDPNKPSIFTIHGYSQSKNSAINHGEHDAWLEVLDCNTIAVDWPSARSLDVLYSIKSQPQVAKRIASFVDYLVIAYKINLDQVIFVGHSLGAHVAGFASRYLTTGKVLAIFALDAGNPLLTFPNTEGFLKKDDAFYTECVTTAAGRLGSVKPLCQATFYINGGIKQPDCLTDTVGLCSHQMSVDYHIEAVKWNNFYSFECENYISAIFRNCSTISRNRMGDITNAFKNVTGVYYTPVNANTPYGTGPIEPY